MMRYPYCFIGLMTAFLAVSCQKTTVWTNEDPDRIPIIFNTMSGDMIENKSIFDPNNFHTHGNRIKVYAHHMENGKRSTEMDGIEATCDGACWNYSPLKYWKRSGLYSFAAHTSYNTAQGGVSGPAARYDPQSETFTLNNWTITEDNQFDFMYSFNERNMEDLTRNPYGPVKLPMKHLLCAVAFEIVNLDDNSKENTFFNSFSFEGLCPEADAVITKDKVTITHDHTAAASETYKVSGQNIKLGYNEKYNIFAHHSAKAGNDGYILVWPHEGEDFQKIKAHFGYTSNGISKPDGLITSEKSEVNNWKAGHRYRYRILIKNGQISFEVKIVPWIDDDIILDER